MTAVPASSPPLHGLLLCGGSSSRMGEPKAGLRYHSEIQSRHGSKLLQPHCQQVHVSIRASQTSDPAFNGLSLIHDAFPFQTPLNGILSAMQQIPSAAWLVLACDMPMITSDTLQILVESRNPHRTATVFVHPETGIMEPLCAIYEPGSFEPFKHAITRGIHGPNQALFTMDVQTIPCPALGEFRSLNTPQEFTQAMQTFRKPASA